MGPAHHVQRGHAAEAFRNISRLLWLLIRILIPLSITLTAARLVEPERLAIRRRRPLLTHGAGVRDLILELLVWLEVTVAEGQALLGEI